MKQIVLFIALLPLLAYSQADARVIVNHGPGIVYDFDFSEDSQWLATGGWDKYTRVYHCETGMEIYSFRDHNERVSSIDFSPDSTLMVTSGYDSLVNIYDVKNNFKLIHSFNPGDAVTKVIFDHLSSGIILAHFNGDISIWLRGDWQKYRQWKAHDGFINEIVLSMNNNLIFSSGRDNMWNFWAVNDETQKFENKLEAPVMVQEISPTADRMCLVYGSTLMEVVDYPNFKEGVAIGNIHAIAYLDFPFYTEPTFSNDGKILAYANENNDIILIDLNSINKSKTKGHTLTVATTHRDFIKKVQFSPNGKYLASSGFDGMIHLAIFNDANIIASTLKKKEETNLAHKEIKSDLDHLNSAFYLDDETMVMMGTNTYYYNVRTGEQKTVNPYLLGNIEFAQIQTELGLYQYNIEALGVWKGEQIATFTVPPWTTDLSFEKLVISDQDKFMRIDLATNKVDYVEKAGKNILWPIYSSNGAYLALMLENGAIEIRDGSNGEKINTLSGWPGKVNNFEFDATGERLIVTYFEHDSRIYDTKTAKVLKEIDHGEWGATSGEFSMDGKSLLFSTFHDRIELYNGENYSKIYSFTPASYLTDASLSPDASEIIYAGGDGCVTVIDRATKKVKVQHYPLVFKGIVSVTPELYYMAPSFIEDEIAFYANDKVFPMEQFDMMYNRPAEVLKAAGHGDPGLIKAYEKAREKRLKKYQGKDPSSGFNAPEIEIVGKDELTGKVVKNEIEFTIKAKDKKLNLERINIWINDVSIYGKPGIPVSGKSVEKTIKLPLATGQNKITVSVFNTEGIESFRETFTVYNEISKNGELYVIGVGTSKYSNEKFNLNYAAKDAEDFVNALSKNKRYDKVHKMMLLNEEVTKANLIALKDFLAEAGRDDMVMMFIAGHGVLDADYTYYYCPHDMNFDVPSANGVSYAELESVLDGIGPLKKLLFMDTCHSGEVDEDDVAINTEETVEADGDVTFRSVWAVESKTGLGMTNTTSLMKSMFLDLRKGTGATVLSSAGGAEYAMESEDWNNGLFTYCLLKGFKEDESDLNGDGILMLSELQIYVSSMVTKLSQGKQTPTSRIMNNEFDYEIR